MKILKKCPACNSKHIKLVENCERYYDCPNCGEIFWSHNGKFYWVNEDAQPTDEEIKPKTFIFREYGLKMGL